MEKVLGLLYGIKWLWVVCTLFTLILLFIAFRRSSLISGVFSVLVICLFGFAVFTYSKPSSITVRQEKMTAASTTMRTSDEQPSMASFIKIEENVLIDAPVVEQFPELPRGCEVTALAMLLQSAGQQADKMELAEQVKKDPTPRKVMNGEIHYGNPHDGFVGDMYTFSKPGLGVYHEPIMELAETYMPGQMVNLTGQDFDELKIPLSDGRPVWVIINAEYRKLEDRYFQTWHTQSGKIRVTQKEHSVLITGYDKDFIYFNDPLTGKKNKKAPIQDFKESWVQMGSQAITYK